jgi:ribonuclease P protein component
MSSYHFLRSERLKSRKVISRIFSEGKSIAIFPLRLVYLQAELPEGAGRVQAGFTVSRRHFKSAVQRNRLKRQMREAWRLQKNNLLDGLPDTTEQFAWMLLYTAKEPLPYAQIEQAMAVLIKRFLKKQRPKS